MPIVNKYIAKKKGSKRFDLGSCFIFLTLEQDVKFASLLSVLLLQLGV